MGNLVRLYECIWLWHVSHPRKAGEEQEGQGEGTQACQEVEPAYSLFTEGKGGGVHCLALQVSFLLWVFHTEYLPNVEVIND